MANLMNILSPSVKIHILTGDDALKSAEEWQKSFEREQARAPYIILFREIRKNVVVAVDIDPQTAYTIGVLADGAEARDRKEKA